MIAKDIRARSFGIRKLMFIYVRKSRRIYIENSLPYPAFMLQDVFGKRPK